MASSPQINQWNEGWRSTPQYQEILKTAGIDPTKKFKLTEQQQKFVQAAIEQSFGFHFPKGVEIDAAGNMNEDEGFGKQLKKWGPIVGGAALAAFGIPFLTPGLLGGVGIGGGAAATGAGAAGAAFDAAPSISSAAGAANAASLGTGAGMNFGWGSVLDLLKKPGTVSAIGSALTSGSQASAQNRGSEIEALLAQQELNQSAQRGYNADVTNRDAAERIALGDAWKRLQQSSYLKNWKPSTTSFSPYTRPLVGPNPDTLAGAENLYKTANDRLAGTTALPQVVQPGPFTIPSDLTHGSMWEKLQGYLGAGAGAYGAFNKPRTS